MRFSVSLAIGFCNSGLFEISTVTQALQYVICACLALLDFLFQANLFDKHAQFNWEEWFGFYPVFGFVACVVLVLISKYVLRPIVMRKEDYYDS